MNEKIQIFVLTLYSGYNIVITVMKLIVLTAVAVAGVFSGINASAQFLETDIPGTATQASVVTTGDLILGATATITNGNLANTTNNPNGDFSGPPAANDTDSVSTQLTDLTDGSAPALLLGHPVVTGSGFAGITNGLVLTYALSSPSTITGIDSFVSGADTGRNQQDYTLSYSTDNGSTYTTLNTVAYTPPVTDNNSEVALTGTLAGVTDIQFSFNNVENNEVGYSELVVTGEAPEPSTYALLGLSLVGLIFLARRKALAV